MEDIRKYLVLFKRWLWLLILCTIIGSAGGYFYSKSQTPIYQSRVRCLVSRAPDESYSDFSYLNDQQLALTYTQMMTSAPILQKVSEIVGVPVKANQIKPSVIQDTQLIEITVEDPNPQVASQIANALVDVFIVYNSELQAARFVESESSLQSQIAQMETQIANIESNLLNVSVTALEDNITKAEAELERLQNEIITKQEEITQIEIAAEQLGTPTSEQRQQLNTKNLELTQMQKLYDLYQQIYTNLVVLGTTGNTDRSQEQSAQLETTLIIYRQIQAELLSSYENIRLARLKSTSNIVSYEPATVSSTPVRPNTRLNVLAGAGIALILSATVIFFKNYFDSTIQTPEEVSEKLKLSVLGFIPEIDKKNPYPITLIEPRSPISEAFRTLRTNLEYTSVDKPLTTIVVTSVLPEEGKSTISVNLAVTMVQGGKKVLLIDADMRRPHVNKLLQIDNMIGLGDLFKNPQLTIDDVIRRWNYKNFMVITAGSPPPNPADLLASKRMASIIENLKSKADLVIIDVPPFIVADGSILASQVDGVLLVAQPGKTPMNGMLATCRQLDRTNAKILGLAFNRIRKTSSYYGGYRYTSKYKSHAYYYGNGTEKSKKKTTNNQSPES